MKKIILFTLFLSSMSVSAQTYSTGVITLTSGYTVKFDTNATTVTMTLVGPSDKWLGLGFGMTTMGQTGDVAGLDYVFTNGPTPINLIWARGSSLTLGSHSTRGSGVTGNFTLSTDSFSMAGLKLYPNPADEIFAIELPNNIEKISVKIFDILGKEVMQKEITTLENTINTSDLSSGNYLVKVQFDDKSYATTLIIQ